MSEHLVFRLNIYNNRNSDTLLIVFSGIGSNYKYRSTLKYSQYDQLYIKDNWANGTSYHLFENGSNIPEIQTTELIDYIKKKKTTVRSLH